MTALNSKWQYEKLSRRRSRSPDNAKLGHFTVLFAEDGQKMYQELQRTCTAIVLLITPFVWWRSRCRRRRDLLKLPICIPEALLSRCLLLAEN